MGWVLLSFFFMVILHVKLLTSQSKPCDLQFSLQSPQAYLDIFGAIFDDNEQVLTNFFKDVSSCKSSNGLGNALVDAMPHDLPYLS